MQALFDKFLALGNNSEEVLKFQCFINLQKKYLSLLGLNSYNLVLILKPKYIIYTLYTLHNFMFTILLALYYSLHHLAGIFTAETMQY